MTQALKRALLSGVAAAALILALYPIPSPATPEWQVWVVDDKGSPIHGALVRLDWQNYSAETIDHEESLYTDENGHVLFPARAFRASLLRRTFGTIKSATGGAHASFGPHAYVTAFGQGKSTGVAVSDGHVTDWTVHLPKCSLELSSSRLDSMYGAGTEILRVSGFVLANPEPKKESDASGNITDEYVFFGGKRIAHRSVSANSISYYAEDFLGTSRVITTSTGSVCYEADFYPYGGERVITNTYAQNYKFEGWVSGFVLANPELKKERDAETSNDDFGARY